MVPSLRNPTLSIHHPGKVWNNFPLIFFLQKLTYTSKNECRVTLTWFYSLTTQPNYRHTKQAGSYHSVLGTSKHGQTKIGNQRVLSASLSAWMIPLLSCIRKKSRAHCSSSLNLAFCLLVCFKKYIMALASVPQQVGTLAHTPKGCGFDF